MPMGPEHAERLGLMMGMLERLQGACFSPERAGMIAIGGLKDDVRRKESEVAADLEAQLKATKTLGLRNALRLTLKDIYKRSGDDEAVLKHLRAMLAENDKAIQERAERMRELREKRHD